MRKVIVFDLWETLACKRICIMQKLLSRFEVPIHDGVFTRYEATVQLQRWKSMEEMAENFLREFKLSVTSANVREVTVTFRHGIDQATLFPGIASLLTRLVREEHRLAILSNTTIFESAVVDRWDLARYFDACVYSWQTGALKPNPKSFEALLAALEVGVEDVLYIDDRLANVQAAHLFGFHSLQFSSVIQCRERLGDLGYLPF